MECKVTTVQYQCLLFLFDGSYLVNQCSYWPHMFSCLLKITVATV